MRKKRFKKVRPIEQFSDKEYYTEFLGACIECSSADHSKYFKKHDPELPRIIRMIGYLKSIDPKTILDIGCGRGRLFWPIAYNFPKSRILGMDREWFGIKRIKKVNKKIRRVNAICEDIVSWETKPSRFDCVVASEVLEHISDVKKAIENIVWVSKKYIIGSVPSKRDSNPDHLRLLTPQILNILFTEVCKEQDVKIKKIQFDYTPKELLFFIRLEK